MRMDIDKYDAAAPLFNRMLAQRSLTLAWTKGTFLETMASSRLVLPSSAGSWAQHLPSTTMRFEDLIPLILAPSHSESDTFIHTHTTFALLVLPFCRSSPRRTLRTSRARESRPRGEMRVLQADSVWYTNISKFVACT